MKNILIILLTISSFFAMGQIQKDTILHHHYENGQLHYSIRVDNDTVTFQSYYQNGQLKLTGMTLRNEKHGSQKKFYENGQLESSENYIDGKQRGEQITYLENGNIQKKNSSLN